MASIEHFRQFLTLSKYLNYSTAAESMFITQPALSRHISALENELDIRLFVRSTQSVKLTPAGEMFRERIGALVEDYDDICSRLRILKAGFSERLCISVPYYAMNDYLGSVPERFSSKYPAVKLQYNIGDPNEAFDALVEGKVDLAIMPSYPMPNMGGLTRQEMFEERLGVLINQNDPLARKSELSLADLRDHSFFSIGNNYFSASWHHTVSMCRKAGFTPKGPALFNQMEALFMGIRRGDGVTVIGRHMRSQESELIAYRPLADEGCSRLISIWYNPENENTSIEKFIKLYSDYLEAPLEGDSEKR